MKHAYLLYTGYGKTKLCLDKIMTARYIPRVLLISTKKIVESAWQEEIDKWYPDQLTYTYITGSVSKKERMKRIKEPVNIFGINTSLLDWYIKETCSVERYRYVKKSKKYPDGKKPIYNTTELLQRFDLIIFDESTLFKNSQSKRFKSVKKWASKAHNVLILSATPSPKNIEDIWAQIYLLDGGKRLGKNITSFRREYGIAVPLPNGFNKYQYPQSSIDEVLDKIKDIVTSIPQPENPLFPEPIIKKIMLTPDPATEQLIKEFKEEYITEIGGKTLLAFSKNQLINKVNQLASGAVYIKNVAMPVHNLKLKAIEHLVKNDPDPVAVMYTYQFDKEALLKLPGARLLDTPKDFEDWNANKIKLGILSPFSAAHGLNLQFSDCKHIYWFSPIWDTEKWIQTNARFARRGQQHQLTIGVLLMKGSFDKYMFDLCQTKFKIQWNTLVKLI